MPATLPFGRWLHKARWVNTAAWKYAQAFHEQASQVAFPAESASGRGIIRWQDWSLCHGGDIAHWEPGPRGMLCRRATLAPASRLITTVYHDAFSCSIREITSLSLESGKGGLATSATLDAYALSECRDLISSDPAWIGKLLSWHELRFNAAPGVGESLESFSWHDRGYHLLNQGGAHHFAAARYLAGFYAPRFCINAPLARYSINLEAAQGILNAFDMFCEPEDRQCSRPSHTAWSRQGFRTQRAQHRRLGTGHIACCCCPGITGKPLAPRRCYASTAGSMSATFCAARSPHRGDAGQDCDRPRWHATPPAARW